jgi:hypothetical protein
MTQYRKKPVVIDAEQWHKNGDHSLDYASAVEGFSDGVLVSFSPEHQKTLGWEGQVVRYYRNPEDDGAGLCHHCLAKKHDHGWIDTLEGGHIVCPGDWIIRGVQGEFYPCKPDIFEATYEVAHESS